jgi:proline-specific peptidase
MSTSSLKKMRVFVLTFIPIISLVLTACAQNQQGYLEISKQEYLDKMTGAWIGQMAGVGWGLPTEFKFPDEIVPLEKVPEWKNEMINQQGNDDLYVEMTFLSSLEKYGLDVSIRQAGIDFANTGYMLWAANKAGRKNLRMGIAPPESSHPNYSNNCDDIDYQIEADFSGIIAPGMPNQAIRFGEKFGRLMNYGDGLYGGQFVGCMYSAAYFENDIGKIIQAGLAGIPEESHYAHCVRDVVKWHQENPDSWQKTWKLIEEKYRISPDYQKYAQKTQAWVPIDAKLNGAYIVLGLLYGNGNMDSTIVISMRGGKDSDCNPSNAAGVLATTIGYKALPEKYKTGLDRTKKFSYSEYDFDDLISLSEDLSKKLILKNGGDISSNDLGQEVFNIAIEEVKPSAFQPSYDPGPFNPENRYSEEELDKITRFTVPKPGQATSDVSGGTIWYHVIGEGTKPPLLMLHGGPGGTCYSLYPLTELSDDRAVILFDQIGGGRSEYISDTSLMTMEYQLEQLHEFIEKLGLEKFYLYGHSWGTMLGLDYYLKYPEGIKGLIFNSPLASTEMWMADADTLIATLPDSIQTAIETNERSQTYDSNEYQEANYVYYKNFISRNPRIKTEYDVERKPGNREMYMYMWGPSEFTTTGTLMNYDRLDRLDEIDIPTLWTTGEYDEARPSTVRYYHSLTPHSEFEVIEGAAHATMHDNQEKNVSVIRDFLEGIEE